MKLLERGRVVEDRFVPIVDDAPLPADAPAILSLARLQRDADTLAGRNVALGVRVGSATRPEDLAPLLDRVALVAIEFPKFRDGRGFSIARALRERYGYVGDIRAFGHILPDQYAFLVRCGVSSVVVPDEADIALWAAALARFHVAYQAGMDAAPVVSGLRRRVALG